MICPVCRLELGVERRADELVLTYRFDEWTAGCRCRARGDPAWCGHLLPHILNLLPESKVSPFRSEPRAAEQHRRGADRGDVS